MILRQVSLKSELDSDEIEESTIAEQIADELRQLGYVVESNVGQSHFRCNLAVCRPESESYKLGILLDGRGYYEQNDLLERDLMKPRLLRAFGWDVAVVLTKDWIADQESVMSDLTGRLADSANI